MTITFNHNQVFSVFFFFYISLLKLVKVENSLVKDMDKLAPHILLVGVYNGTNILEGNLALYLKYVYPLTYFYEFIKKVSHKSINL